MDTGGLECVTIQSRPDATTTVAGSFSEFTMSEQSSARRARSQLSEKQRDSLSDTDVRLTERQVEELDRRLDDLDREGAPIGILWGDVLKRLECGSS